VGLNAFVFHAVKHDQRANRIRRIGRPIGNGLGQAGERGQAKNRHAKNRDEDKRSPGSPCHGRNSPFLISTFAFRGRFSKMNFFFEKQISLVIQLRVSGEPASDAGFGPARGRDDYSNESI
jgi:hypothetical protein